MVDLILSHTKQKLEKNQIVDKTFMTMKDSEDDDDDGDDEGDMK